METATLSSQTGIIDRTQLALVPTPIGTATHRPIPHHEVVNALVETLGFRHIGVVKDQYAVDRTGNKMFGALDLDTAQHDFRFSIALRNSHDKSMRLALTVGYKVFVCDNMAFSGDFEPVLAKHSKHFNPQYPEFQARTMWSLSNAFTSAFKELEPVPAFRATAKLADFLKGIS